MTLTPEQLDELERDANRVTQERGVERDHARIDLADHAPRILHLVSVYRAALAFVTTDHGDHSLHREMYDKLRTVLGMP